MPLTAASYLLGSHVFFFRDGDAYTVPGAGTASRTAKPGAADPAWIKIGEVEEAEWGIEAGNDIEVWAPTPGRQRLKDKFENREKNMLSFTTNELSNLVIENLFRTLALNAGATQFNPLEGKLKKGWLKFQSYDQDDAVRIVLDVFVHLKISGRLQVGGTDIVKPQWEATVLHSTLNTGTL